MNTHNKSPVEGLVLNKSEEMDLIDIDSMGNVYIKLKNPENDRLVNIRLERTLVIELFRGFLEKTLSEYFGPNNRVQIISVKDAVDKIKTRQLTTGYKKPLLTRREVQIMECLVGGKINKEIASELRLSTNTVRNHLRSIFMKLCVESRAEAIGRYLSANVRPNHPTG